jgi:uncharacterized integral membrane protein
MLGRIVWLVIAFPAALLLIALAVANRHGVPLILDPFRPEAPALSIQLPLYAYIFAALVTGVVLGGAAAWSGQSRWRKTARMRTQDAMRWQAEADRLARERDSRVAATKALVAGK